MTEPYYLDFNKSKSKRKYNAKPNKDNIYHLFYNKSQSNIDRCKISDIFILTKIHLEQLKNKKKGDNDNE